MFFQLTQAEAMNLFKVVAGVKDTGTAYAAGDVLQRHQVIPSSREGLGLGIVLSAQ